MSCTSSPPRAGFTMKLRPFPTCGSCCARFSLFSNLPIEKAPPNLVPGAFWGRSIRCECRGRRSWAIPGSLFGFSCLNERINSIITRLVTPSISGPPSPAKTRPRASPPLLRPGFMIRCGPACLRGRRGNYLGRLFWGSA